MELVIRATTPSSNSSRPTEIGAGSGSGGVGLLVGDDEGGEGGDPAHRAEDRAQNGQDVAGVLIGAADLEFMARRPGQPLRLIQLR